MLSNMSRNIYKFANMTAKLPKHKMLIDPKTCRMAHPVYKLEDIGDVKADHYEPQNYKDKLALKFTEIMRKSWDFATGYNENYMHEKYWLRRVVFLETIAGVPGMVAGMLRHMKSLRSLERD